MPASLSETTTSTSLLRCLVVDNDPLSVQLLLNYIANTPLTQAVGSCADATEATDFLRTQSQLPDVLFLAADLSVLLGIDLPRGQLDFPYVIQLTSGGRHAGPASGFAVADTLLKPLSYPRFLQATQKALELVTAQHTAEVDNVSVAPVPTVEPDFTFVKLDTKLVRVDFKEVQYVEARGDYVHIVTSQNKLIVYSTMRAVEEKFPPAQFVRVHRSFIANINCIQVLEDNSLLIKDKYIPVGQTYLRSVLQRLNRL